MSPRSPRGLGIPGRSLLLSSDSPKLCHKHPTFCSASHKRGPSHEITRPSSSAPLKYIFYPIPHGAIAAFVCGTLRFLPCPDVLYLQLVARLTWQADVWPPAPESALGHKSLVSPTACALPAPAQWDPHGDCIRTFIPCLYQLPRPRA